MTEKRFAHEDLSLFIDGAYFCELEDGDEITELLNRQQFTIDHNLKVLAKLEKENEQLKQQLNDRIKYTHQLEAELKKLR